MARTIDEIQAEIDAFESQFAVPMIPAGTPNRKAFQQAARQEAHARACLPGNVERRLALIAERRATEKSAKLRVAAARRKADPEQQVRQWMYRRLRAMGFCRETATDGSAYYEHREADLRVRVSDHDVPLTAEREWNLACGGFSWANTWTSFVIGESRIDAAKWLVRVRRELRAGAMA